MKRFKVIVTSILLIASLFLLFDKLFTPQPIQITLETGQEVTTQSPDYFSLSQVLLFIICSFVIGGASIYLFYNAELQALSIVPKNRELDEKYSEMLPLLKEDERMVVRELLKHKGVLLQNALVSSLNISKVTATRILRRLEQKGLVSKERQGFTNKIVLKK